MHVGALGRHKVAPPNPGGGSGPIVAVHHVTVGPDRVQPDGDVTAPWVTALDLISICSITFDRACHGGKPPPGGRGQGVDGCPPAMGRGFSLKFSILKKFIAVGLTPPYC